jgi:hypothetical protein
MSASQSTRPGYITAAQAVSWIAFRDLNGVHHALSEYPTAMATKWGHSSLGDILSCFQAIRDETEWPISDTPDPFTKERIDALIKRKGKPIGELIAEISADIAKQVDNQKIEQAANELLNALRAGDLVMDGVVEGGDGMEAEIPKGVYRQQAVLLVWSNELAFSHVLKPVDCAAKTLPKKMSELWLKKKAVIDFVDGTHNDKATAPMQKTTPDNRSKSRPNKDEVREIAREVYNAAPDGKKPNSCVADQKITAIINSRFTKPAGNCRETKEAIVRIVLRESEFADQRNQEKALKSNFGNFVFSKIPSYLSKSRCVPTSTQAHREHDEQ